MECEFCGKNLSSKSNLKYHQKTTKYCLKIQGKIPRDNFSCSKCGRGFVRKLHFKRHEKNCRYQKQVCDKCSMIGFLQQKIEDQEEEIHSLREQLSLEEGKFIGYDTAVKNNKLKSQTVNNYIHPKLLHVKVDNIRPFTIETVKQELEEGNFTREMFENGHCGILEFVSSIISIENENGEIERSYACTDSSRNKFHRLVESKEWKTDNGAHFLNDVLNQLNPIIQGYFEEVLDRRRTLRIESGEEEDDYYNEALARIYCSKIELLKPIYDGIKNNKGKAREKLFNTLRNRISSIASV